jgi:hypothetical protein
VTAAALRSLLLLRLALAVVLAAQGMALATRPQAGVEAALPVVVRVALGTAEAVAAVLFLFPSTVLAGGYALGAILLAAAGLHLWLGLRPPASYVVYLTAILAAVHNSPPAAARR